MPILKNMRISKLSLLKLLTSMEFFFSATSTKTCFFYLFLFCLTNSLTKKWEMNRSIDGDSREPNKKLPGFLPGWKLVPPLWGRKTPVPQHFLSKSRKIACIPGPPDALFPENIGFICWGFQLFFECCFIININISIKFTLEVC